MPTKAKTWRRHSQTALAVTQRKGNAKGKRVQESIKDNNYIQPCQIKVQVRPCTDARKVFHFWELPK